MNFSSVSESAFVMFGGLIFWVLDLCTLKGCNFLISNSFCKIVSVLDASRGGVQVWVGHQKQRSPLPRSSLPWAVNCSVTSQFTLCAIDFHEIPSLTLHISFCHWTFSMIRKTMDFQAILFLTDHNLSHCNKQIFLFWKQSSRWAYVVFISVFAPNYEPMKIEHICMNHIWEVWTCGKTTVKMER
jgi:hypothetical protein